MTTTSATFGYELLTNELNELFEVSGFDLRAYFYSTRKGRNDRIIIYRPSLVDSGEVSHILKNGVGSVTYELESPFSFKLRLNEFTMQSKLSEAEKDILNKYLKEKNRQKRVLLPRSI